jgi:hypothetical protein
MERIYQWFINYLLLLTAGIAIFVFAAALISALT